MDLLLFRSALLPPASQLATTAATANGTGSGAPSNTGVTTKIAQRMNAVGGTPQVPTWTTIGPLLSDAANTQHNLSLKRAGECDYLHRDGMTTTSMAMA